MAYENLQLVIAGLSGEIYLAKVNKGGLMSDSRRIVTSECIRSTAEWFMKNKKKMVSYEVEPGSGKPTLFYTQDSNKVKKILEILQED